MYGLGLISKTDSESNQLYYLADGLGSATRLTDDQGDVVGTYTYDVFGAIRSETGGQLNNFKFTRQQLDTETGFYYLRARYYDPATGRLLTRDPFAGLTAMPKTLNRYAYVMNNPALYIDPLGLFPPTLGDVGNFVQDRGDDLRDAGGDATEFVNEHVVQPTADFLSDPENVLSAAQIGSGYVAQVMCEGGMNPVCAGALAVYGVSTIGKAALADSWCEAGITLATGFLGNPKVEGNKAYALAGLSGVIEGIGCPTPVGANGGRIPTKE